ncbi:MAG: hypothetical protein GAK40_00058 [Burkholderia plantarii]|nr:MAG: hypothetical protein GAK40_00058 [Burkholderia plantarii]
MALADAPLLYAFEIESSEDFTFIPMIVRFHLDYAGLRISLAQWQCLPLEARRLLCRFPADADAGTWSGAGTAAGVDPGSDAAASFEATLHALLARQAAGEAERFAPEPAPAWRDGAAPPPALAAQCALAGLAPVAPAQWRALGGFQRYVLTKLSRKPKLNHDFVPAMREFGLA